MGIFHSYFDITRGSHDFPMKNMVIFQAPVLHRWTLAGPVLLGIQKEFLLVPLSASVARSSWSPCPMLLQSLVLVGKNIQNLSVLVVGQVSYPIAGRLQQIPYQLLLGWFIKLHHAKTINTWQGRPVTPIAWPTPKSVSHQHSQKKPYESGKCIWTVWVNCMGTYPGMGIPLFEVTLSHAVNTPRSRCSMKRTFNLRPR